MLDFVTIGRIPQPAWSFRRTAGVALVVTGSSFPSEWPSDERWADRRDESFAAEPELRGRYRPERGLRWDRRARTDRRDASDGISALDHRQPYHHGTEIAYRPRHGMRRQTVRHGGDMRADQDS